MRVSTINSFAASFLLTCVTTKVQKGLRLEHEIVTPDAKYNIQWILLSLPTANLTMLVGALSRRGQMCAACGELQRVVSKSIHIYFINKLVLT